MENIIKNGLRSLPPDLRDFSRDVVFGSIKVESIPLKDFIVGEQQPIKDQRGTLECTAYTASTVNSILQETNLDEKYQAAKISELLGYDINIKGANLRVACQSLTKFGSIPKDTDWDDEKARKFAAKSFFKVDGGYDTFDNIRVALWMHRKELRGIITGSLWRNDWFPSDGKIPHQVSSGGFGHAFSIIGQKIFDGVPYLIAHLSNGLIGHKGWFYFPREAVNRDLKFGCFMLHDLDKITAEELNKMKKKLSIMKKILLKLSRIINLWLKK